MTRWRRAVVGGLAIGATVAGVMAAVHFPRPRPAVLQVAFPSATLACHDTRIDAGLPIAPVDSGTDAGPNYAVTLSGVTEIPGLTVTIYDGDVGNEIASFAVDEKGGWQREVVLSTGWHKLIFRAVDAGGRSWDAVRWIGLDNDDPVWSGTWSHDDGGCTDANCPPIGYVKRCGSKVDPDGGYQRTDGGGWCSAAVSRTGFEVWVNFAGIHDDGCGPHIVWVFTERTTLGWPPPDGWPASDFATDSGVDMYHPPDAYSWDTYRASVDERLKWMCRPWTGGPPSVPEFPGSHGTPACHGQFCCVATGGFDGGL